MIQEYRLAIEHEMPEGWNWWPAKPRTDGKGIWVGVYGEEMPDAEYGYGDDEVSALAMLLGRLVFKKIRAEHIRHRSEYYWVDNDD